MHLVVRRDEALVERDGNGIEVIDTGPGPTFIIGANIRQE